MMLCMLGFVMMALTANGQGTSTPPQKCCISHQFTATLGEIGGMVENGIGVPMEGYEFLVYDYDAKLMSIQSVDKDIASGTFSNSTIIVDYNTNKQYFLSGGRCFTHNITQPMREPCITSNSQYLGRAVFGSGTSTLEVDVWEFQTSGGNAVSKLAVSTDNCTPIVEASYGTIHGVESVRTLFFTGFKATIDDRSPLTIPSNCEPLDHGDVIGRRFVPLS